MMLRLEKATLGKFGAQDMMGLIESQGWKAILPNALEDRHLLLVSDQFRDLLSGIGWNGGHDSAGAALPIALLLLSKADAKRLDDGVEIGMETLQEALFLLSTAFDREIVNRMLLRQNANPIGTGLIQGLEMLLNHAREHADPACHA